MKKISNFFFFLWLKNIVLYIYLQYWMRPFFLIVSGTSEGNAYVKSKSIFCWLSVLTVTTLISHLMLYTLKLLVFYTNKVAISLYCKIWLVTENTIRLKMCVKLRQIKENIRGQWLKTVCRIEFGKNKNKKKPFVKR